MVDRNVARIDWLAAIEASVALVALHDPLAVGLGFRNEFRNGKNFAATLKGLQSTAAQPGIESKVEELGSAIQMELQL